MLDDVIVSLNQTLPNYTHRERERERERERPGWGKGRRWGLRRPIRRRLGCRWIEAASMASRTWTFQTRLIPPLFVCDYRDRRTLEMSKSGLETETVMRENPCSWNVPIWTLQNILAGLNAVLLTKFGFFSNKNQTRAFGLVVWFSLRVREVPGSIPGMPHFYKFCQCCLRSMKL